VILLFASKLEADTLLKQNPVLPFSGMILWAGSANPQFNFDSEISVVSYLEGADGRCAMQVYLDELDADWLVAQGFTLVESLPSDWVYKE